MAPAAFPDPANGPLHHNGIVIPHISVNTSTGAIATFDTDWVGLGTLKDGASNTLLVGERRWKYGREEDATQLDEDNGIATLDVHGVRVRITDPDRTTLDLWRYPRRISVEHATEALRRRVGAEAFEMPRFARLGQRLGVWHRVEPIARGLALR